MSCWDKGEGWEIDPCYHIPESESRDLIRGRFHDSRTIKEVVCYGLD